MTTTESADRRSWRWVAYCLFAVAFGTNVPTPLLLVYRERMGLSATVLTAIFAVYAAGLLPALLLAGPASDRRGRRFVANPFVVLSAIASLVFVAAARSVPLLFAGRFIQGAVSGVVFSVGSAWLTELTGAEHAGRAARRATVALSAGWALGPLSAGLLAQWAPAPTVVPYALHLLIMAPALVALAFVPETLTRRGRGPLVNLGIPAGAGVAFWSFVAPAAVCVFTFPSISITVLPLLLQRSMQGFDVAVTGVTAGVTMLMGVVVQPLGKRLSAPRAAPVGVALGAAGVAVSLLADAWGLWWLLLPTAALLGSGYGLCLASGLTASEWLAEPDARGALTASFYACAYLGFAAPLLVSLAATPERGFVPPLATLAIGGGVLAVLLAVGPGRRALQARRRALHETVGAAASS